MDVATTIFRGPLGSGGPVTIASEYDCKYYVQDNYAGKSNGSESIGSPPKAFEAIRAFFGDELGNAIGDELPVDTS